MFQGKFLSQNVKISSVYDPTTGTSTSILASNTVDMTGFEGCCFIATVGATSTAVSMSVQAATSTTAGDFATMTKGTTAVTLSTTASNGCLYIDVVKPTMRYLRCLWNSTGGGNTGGGMVAIQYGARTAPTTNASTDVLTSEFLVST